MSTEAELAESVLADSLRADETRLYAEYGFVPSEGFVHVEVDSGGESQGVDVRVVSIPGDEAKIPVLLLHGVASVTAAAIPLIPSFGGAPVVAIDWPGHGLSGAFRFGARSDLRGFAVRVIDAVADATGLERFDIVAHSLGGQFALYYCQARPGRVRRLVLPGVPGAAFAQLSPPLGMRLAAIPGLGRALIKPVSLEQYRTNSAMTLGAGAVDPWPPELVSVGWFASRRAAFAETLPGLFRSIASVFGVRAGAVIPAESLAAITTPTLFVWGDKDVFMTPAAGRPSWSRMPHAEIVEVTGGHAPWLNSPEETGAAVREFLGRD